LVLAEVVAGFADETLAVLVLLTVVLIVDVVKYVLVLVVPPVVWIVVLVMTVTV